MASFLDSVPNFNPYVQQLPVEAMFGVGTQKQQAYNEGITRIQSYIDNVAGMDVVRDVDKNYLQQKLNTLGNQLKVFGAADFSDFQLQNSAMGMINDISKDRNVVNALVSTQNYRKALEQREVYEKEGKTSASNDWLFQREVQNWLGSDDVKSTFNSSYNPYSDYRKKALEVIKSVTGDETVTDDAFTIDEKGDVVIADAMIREKWKGVTPEKIQESLLAGLDPSDLRQMEIDGMYQYSNVSDEEFVKRINSKFSEEYDHYMQKRNILERSLPLTTDVSQKDEILKSMGAIDTHLSRLQKEYNNIGSTFSSGNVDAARARLYANNFMEQFSKAFSFSETSRTIHESPYANMQKWREDLSWRKESFWLNYDQSERQHAEKMKLELEKLKDEEGVFLPSNPANIDQSLLPDYSVEKVEEDIRNGLESLSLQENEFLKSFLGKDNITQEDKDFLDQQYIKYLERPNDVEIELREYFSGIEQQKRKLKSDTDMLRQIETQVESEFGRLEYMIPSDVEGIPIQKGGRIINYSPVQLTLLNNKLNTLKIWDKKIPSRDSFTNTVNYTYDDVRAKEELTADEYALFQIVKKGDIKKSSLNEGEKVVYESLQEVYQKSNRPLFKRVENMNKRRDELIKERLTTTQGMIYGIPSATNIQKAQLQNFLLGIHSNAKQTKNAKEKSPNLDVEVLGKLINDPNIRATITVIEGTQIQEPTYKINVSGSEGSTEFYLNEAEKVSNFVPGMFDRKGDYQVVKPYLEQIRKMGGKTTGYGGSYRTTKENAFLNTNEFGSTKHYGVTGNIVTMDGVNYGLKINIYDPIEKRWRENIDILNNRTPIENIPEVMRRITDEALFKLIYGKDPTSEDLKKLERAAKVPL